MSAGNRRFFRRSAYENSINGGLALILIDAVFLGSYMFSELVCPIWLAVSVVRAIVTRPGLRVAIVRASFPVMVLILVVANSLLQEWIAGHNAARVIAACEEFRNETGDYPDRLDQLVPRYLHSIPRAKYCIFCNDFHYHNSRYLPPIIYWYPMPFASRDYSFGTHEWRSLD
jgi:hypothetical protein